MIAASSALIVAIAQTILLKSALRLQGVARGSRISPANHVQISCENAGVPERVR